VRHPDRSADLFGEVRGGGVRHKPVQMRGKEGRQSRHRPPRCRGQAPLADHQPGPGRQQGHDLRTSRHSSSIERDPGPGTFAAAHPLREVVRGVAEG